MVPYYENKVKAVIALREACKHTHVELHAQEDGTAKEVTVSGPNLKDAKEMVEGIMLLGMLEYARELQKHFTISRDAVQEALKLTPDKLTHLIF